METKQMAIADLNVVFGKKEEPFLSRMDDIVLPALRSGIERTSSKNTRFLFEECEIAEFENELVLKGILIKDTILDVMSEYTENGLQKTNKHFPSSPYSIFMIFLKNHRMILVKNQNGSPDIRSFKTTITFVLREYIYRQNQIRRENGEVLLPHVRANVSGIKTSQSVKDALKDVERITELTFQFYPLNAEWDYDPVFGAIDSSIRKVIGSNKGRMVFPSPGSKDGVAEVVARTEGLVKTKMKVEYKSDSEKGRTQRTGTIKDNEISDVSNIDIEGELDNSFDTIYEYKKEFHSLNIKSKNNLILYEEYIRKKNNGDV